MAAEMGLQGLAHSTSVHLQGWRSLCQRLTTFRLKTVFLITSNWNPLGSSLCLLALNFRFFDR